MFAGAGMVSDVDGALAALVADRKVIPDVGAPIVSEATAFADAPPASVTEYVNESEPT